MTSVIPSISSNVRTINETVTKFQFLDII